MSDSAADGGVAAGGTGAGKTSIVEARAYGSMGAWVRFLVPAAVGLTADLWLKAWSFPGGVPANALSQVMSVGRNWCGTRDYPIEPWPVIPHVLGFTTTVNEGAVFGLGQGHVGLFLVFSVFALGVILWVFLTSWRSHWLVHVALGLITAGALGNMYDRAVFHAVRDMLRFYVSWYQYIFNIADVCLCIGVPLLIMRWLFVKDEGQVSVRE